MAEQGRFYRTMMKINDYIMKQMIPASLQLFAAQLYEQHPEKIPAKLLGFCTFQRPLKVGTQLKHWNTHRVHFVSSVHSLSQPRICDLTKRCHPQSFILFCLSRCTEPPRAGRSSSSPVAIKRSLAEAGGASGFLRRAIQ